MTNHPSQPSTTIRWLHVGSHPIGRGPIWRRLGLRGRRRAPGGARAEGVIALLPADVAAGLFHDRLDFPGAQVRVGGEHQRGDPGGLRAVKELPPRTSTSAIWSFSFEKIAPFSGRAQRGNPPNTPVTSGLARGSDNG